MKLVRLMPLLALLPMASLATECPPDMKQGCTILFLSPPEVQILVQPGGILATAADARKLDYAAAVQFFLQKIKDAPRGEVKEEKPAEPTKP